MQPPFYRPADQMMTLPCPKKPGIPLLTNWKFRPVFLTWKYLEIIP